MTAFGHRLVLAPQLQQRCVLSQELRQSLRLLRMSAVELAEFVREMERDNPLLEVEWPDALVSAGRRSGASSGSGRGVHGAGFGSVAAALPDTLEQVLASQIRLADAAPPIKRGAVYLAGNLNDDGYLTIDLIEAADALGMPLPDAEASLSLLQSLDPAGVGARTLAECLLLQAARDSGAPPCFEQLVQDHLRDVAKGKWRTIAHALKIGGDEVTEAVRYLRRLSPRPGLAHAARSVPCILPEARLALAPDGRTEIRYGRGSVPRIIAQSGWPDARGGGPAWRTWAERKAREAERLAEHLAFRERTVRGVIRAIADEQQAFLAAGTAAIRPMTLEKVAVRLGCHPSTVSRAVRDKFVDTDYGVMPLERFFSSRLDTADGEEVSARAVKTRIRCLIEQEDKRRPMSDAELAAALQREGVRISRRTVAKYRMQERLLPSSLR